MEKSVFYLPEQPWQEFIEPEGMNGLIGRGKILTRNLGLHANGLSTKCSTVRSPHSVCIPWAVSSSQCHFSCTHFTDSIIPCMQPESTEVMYLLQNAKAVCLSVPYSYSTFGNSGIKASWNLSWSYEKSNIFKAWLRLFISAEKRLVLQRSERLKWLLYLELFSINK